MAQLQHKLWAKQRDSEQSDSDALLAQHVERFTVGEDRIMDKRLAPWDVLGSIAHGIMLCDIGLLSSEECEHIVHVLRTLYEVVQRDDFAIEEGVEDIHSQIELLLTLALGDIGKKIHSGRSRNDQALTDIKLYVRSALLECAESVSALCEQLCDLAER